MFERIVKIDFGVIEYDKSNILLEYYEKPTYNFDVSMGINAMSKEAIIPHLELGKYLDIPDLMLKLKDSGQKVYCQKQKCDWLDIGRIDDYQMAIEKFDKNKNKFLPGIE